MEGFRGEKIIFEGKRAVGVKGIWTSRGQNRLPGGEGAYERKVLIKANKAVIVASGALMTPILLKNSGLTNPHIGSHLKLHPCGRLGAVFKERTSPWDGSIMTSVVTDLENQDGAYHGVKLEAITMLPGWFLPSCLNWNDGLSYKEQCAKMGHMTGYIALCRESGEGRVYVDADEPGRCRIAYEVSRKDHQHIVNGLEALAKINYIMGAQEIFAGGLPNVPSFHRSPTADSPSSPEDTHGINDPAFQHWLDTYIRPVAYSGAYLADTTFGSAHQMGSARMGTNPRSSAVDPKGRPWGYEGLYVVDNSVFPAASGVNPMITSMGTARGLARGIVRDLVPGAGVAAAKI